MIRLLLLLILITSCTKEDLLTTCQGDCSATMEVPGSIDSNGYYHVTNKGLDYFNIKLYATPTSPELRYNHRPVVMADPKSDKIYRYKNPNILGFYEDDPVINGITYFSEEIKDGKIYANVRVDHLPPMVGDTLNLTVRVFWEAGSYSKLIYLEEKIIIE